MFTTKVAVPPKINATPLAAGLLAGLLLSGCATTDTKQASLPDQPTSKHATQTAAAPMPARLPAERAIDPQIAAAGEPLGLESEPPALDTPPSGTASAAATQTASLDEMVMAPTAAAPGSNSIFASRQTAYAPSEPSAPRSTSTSLVPDNLPVRSGINPSAGSLFSAPKAAESYQAYADPAVVSTPDPAAEQLVTPEPAEVAYDPAEPVSEAAEPAEDGKKKSFSLMRLLGRKGG